MTERLRDRTRQPKHSAASSGSDAADTRDSNEEDGDVVGNRHSATQRTKDLLTIDNGQFTDQPTKKALKRQPAVVDVSDENSGGSRETAVELQNNGVVSKPVYKPPVSKFPITRQQPSNIVTPSTLLHQNGAAASNERVGTATDVDRTNKIVQQNNFSEPSAEKREKTESSPAAGFDGRRYLKSSKSKIGDVTAAKTEFVEGEKANIVTVEHSSRRNSQTKIEFDPSEAPYNHVDTPRLVLPKSQSFGERKSNSFATVGNFTNNQVQPSNDRYNVTRPVTVRDSENVIINENTSANESSKSSNQNAVSRKSAKVSLLSQLIYLFLVYV